jgi:L-aspartate oxidase
MKRLGTWCVYLDVTHLPKEQIQHEFPMICEKLASIDLEIYKDWIPVVPAQHYSCGGVRTDLDGRTTVPGLYASGEVASTGVHGANRLASNSLLEGIVFSTAAAEACATADWPEGQATAIKAKSIAEADSVRLRHALQRTMTNFVGISRSTAGLEEAERTVQGLLNEYDRLPSAPFSMHPLETRNLLVAAQLVVKGALARHENIGLHYNVDNVTATLLGTEERGPAEASVAPSPAD